MSVGTIFLDSCGDHYATGDILMKWSAMAGGTWVRTGGARTGTECLMTTNITSPFGANILNDSLRLNLSGSYATASCGFAYKAGGLFGTNFLGMVAFGFDGSTHASLCMLGDGSFAIARGWITGYNGSIVARSAPGLFRPGVWQYYEMEVTVGHSGSVTLKQNGATIISASGVDVQVGPNAFVDQFALMNGAGGFDSTASLYDDIYLRDGGFLGDIGVYDIFPNGAGANTQWTPSSAPNWSCVDDATPNGDTDYVEDSTVGDIDTYAMQDVPAGPTTVATIQNIFNARKTDAGVRKVATVIRSGVTNFVAATDHTLSSNYLYYWDNYDTDPNTASAWTVLNVNAVEGGYKVTA